jgi:hypothetical protein
MMSIETAKFDFLYGKILSKMGDATRAKELAIALYQIGQDLGLDNSELLKYIGTNGLQFNNTIYAKLNQARTNSSQIGFLDESNIPTSIRQQVA